MLDKYNLHYGGLKMYNDLDELERLRFEEPYVVEEVEPQKKSSIFR